MKNLIKTLVRKAIEGEKSLLEMRSLVNNGLSPYVINNEIMSKGGAKQHPIGTANPTSKRNELNILTMFESKMEEEHSEQQERAKEASTTDVPVLSSSTVLMVEPI
jgi:hypothetical protein